jgi:hypothetical protein
MFFKVTWKEADGSGLGLNMVQLENYVTMAEGLSGHVLKVVHE